MSTSRKILDQVTVPKRESTKCWLQGTLTAGDYTILEKFKARYPSYEMAYDMVNEWMCATGDSRIPDADDIYSVVYALYDKVASPDELRELFTANRLKIKRLTDYVLYAMSQLPSAGGIGSSENPDGDKQYK